MIFCGLLLEIIRSEEMVSTVEVLELGLMASFISREGQEIRNLRKLEVGEHGDRSWDNWELGSGGGWRDVMGRHVWMMVHRERSRAMHVSAHGKREWMSGVMVIAVLYGGYWSGGG
ncbi:hypothetical protein L1887_20820 [Cichorium endivia]|nr:hypothetical protein L1887_20820 [Cichorium endivia]